MLSIDTTLSVDQLIGVFLTKGGRINNYYLEGLNRNKPSLVFLNGWFKGKNIREAILRALK